MATKKISELNTLTTPESDDLIAIVDASATETKKITYGNISKHIVNVGTEVEEDSRVNFIKSKNLFDKNNVNKLVGYFNESTPTITSSEFNRTLYLPCKGNTTYTITIPDGTGAYAIGYTTTIPTIGSSVSGVSNTNKTITTGANAKYLVMRYFQTNNATITEQQAFDGIQIEYGDTATSYEPYTQNQIVVDNEKYTDTINVGQFDGRSRVNVLKGKNLFDKDNVNKLSGIYISIANGSIGAYQGNYTLYIQCKSNTTYTIQKISGEAFRVATFTNTPVVGSTATTFQINTTGTTITITTGASDKYLAVQYMGVDDTLTEIQILDSIQIEEGSTATTYSPFIPNQIQVDNEKYTDTLKVGTSIDSRSRVNIIRQVNNILPKGTIYTLTDGSVSLNFKVPKANTQYTMKTNLPATSDTALVFFGSGADAQVSSSVNGVWVGSPRTMTSDANGYVTIAFRYLSNYSSIKLGDYWYTLAEGTLGVDYIVPSINVDGEMLVSKNTYSTSEVVIGEWLGKPLYRKIITATNLSTNQNNDIDLSGYSTMEIKKIEGYNVGGGSGYIAPINTFWSIDTTSARACCYYLSTTGKLKSYCGQYLTTTNKYDTYITLEYTKTTD